MNKRGWFIPILIVSVNALAIALQWAFLPESLPAHFDLDGNARGEMSRSALLLYPLISAAVCLAVYMIARNKPKIHTGLLILASGISLVILCSALVTLTSGTMPVLMLAEPVILLAAIVAFAVSIIRSLCSKI